MAQVCEAVLRVILVQFAACARRGCYDPVCTQQCPFSRAFVSRQRLNTSVQGSVDSRQAGSHSRGSAENATSQSQHCTNEQNKKRSRTHFCSALRYSAPCPALAEAATWCSLRMAVSRSPSLAFIGRVLFAFLFISSGFQKLASFNWDNGGPVMAGMAPKMDNFLSNVDKSFGVKLPVSQGEYKYMLGIAIFLELAGGLLFIFNSSVGALLLVLFMVAVTPVMHNFWDEKENSQGRLNETINFFKNVAIVGSLLFYIGGRPRARKLHSD